MPDTYGKDPDIVTRHIAGESLLIPIRGKLADLQTIYALNPVAEFIWARIDGTHTLAHIVDEVTATFEVSREQAERDTREFVQALLGENLVRLAAGTPGAPDTPERNR
ncbi:MAG: PqqD family protein [Kiritimatiellae bacterium]|nr:PqqD family protein [Kiritimatiellia bacterium]